MGVETREGKSLDCMTGEHCDCESKNCECQCHDEEQKPLTAGK